MDLLAQFLRPVQETILVSLQTIYAACDIQACRSLVLAIIVFSLCFVFAFGSAMNSTSCMLSLSMLVPACALEIRDLLLKIEEKGQLLNPTINLLERVTDNAAWVVAILCIASFVLSAMGSGVPAMLQPVILGIYYFNMIYPHSKLPELPLDSFLCCIASFSIVYLFVCSKTLKSHICTLAYAVLSSFGLLSILESIATDDDSELFINFREVGGYAFHAMVGISILLQCTMRSIFSVKQYLMSRINDEVIGK